MSPGTLESIAKTQTRGNHLAQVLEFRVAESFKVPPTRFSHVGWGDLGPCCSLGGILLHAFGSVVWDSPGAILPSWTLMASLCSCLPLQATKAETCSPWLLYLSSGDLGILEPDRQVITLVDTARSLTSLFTQDDELVMVSCLASCKSSLRLLS